MGISKGGASLIFELKTSESLAGKICTLGRQSCHVTPHQLCSISEKFGFGLAPSVDILGNTVDDDYLFRSLGFDSVESIDVNDYENATHIIDFNNELPNELAGLYDAVYDGGTLEHIFNLPQCLKNIHKLLKPGGIIMHALPSSNHVDHGFYMFSPTLFYDYYTTNRWNVLRSNIFEYTRKHNIDDWLIYNYFPGSIDNLSFGGWGGKKMLGIWFVARKMVDSRCDLIPMQGSYLSLWEESKIGRTKFIPIASESYIKKKIKSNSIIYFLARNILAIFRAITAKRNSNKPKIIARY